MSVDMAAESSSHGDSAPSVDHNGSASESTAYELSNGVSGGAVTPLHTANGTREVGALNGSGGRAVRSVKEQKLIARGRQLLHVYQQKSREHRAILDEMCFSASPESELSAVELLSEMVFKKNGYAGDSGESEATAARAFATPEDSGENWLGKSSFEGEEQLGQLQSTNQRLLDSIEEQLETLWAALGDHGVKSEAVGTIWSSISQLMQQKRATEAQIAYHVQTKSSSSPTQSGQNPEDVDPTRVQELEKELEDSKALIAELNGRVNVLKAQLALAASSSSQAFSDDSSLDSNGHAHSAGADMRRLQNRIQEKDELLLSLRTSLEHVVQGHTELDEELRKSQVMIERLEGEKDQMEKAAADKRTLLHRAYVVKAKQLDQLCKDVELSSSWERVTDENGIVYYRQNDRACAPELEDPRVALVLERLAPTLQAVRSSSPRSAAGRMEQAAHSARAFDRKSSSSSFDSTVSCEDIAIPPEDGTKHEVEDFETPLPEGWEMRVTTAGSVFFVNRITNVTTWKDPRKYKRGNSSKTKRASAPAELAPTRIRVEMPDRSPSGGAIGLSSSIGAADDGDRFRRFDVVFEEKGPIGIHFQANMPDAGATVRRLLPRMAAARTEQIETFDRLIAVNKNPVDSAPFRYVMLLLQGGLRPLTLTFERDLTRKLGRTASEELEHTELMTGHAHHHLDEEVVLDTDGESDSLRQARENGSYDVGRSDSVDSSETNDETSLVRSHLRASAASVEARDDDFSIADKIITNLFSLFWTPPEQLHSQVETV